MVPFLFRHCMMWRNAQSTLKGYSAIQFQQHILCLGCGHHLGRNSLSKQDCEQLNAPLTMEELAQCIKSAKCGKAADLDGMTMEEAAVAYKFIKHIGVY